MSKLKVRVVLSNCLFCLDKIAKLEVRDDEDSQGEVENCIPNFKLVCEYVVGRNSRLNSFCSGGEVGRCLCMNCYELAVKITKLHEEIEKAAAEIRVLIQRNETEALAGEERTVQRRSRSGGIKKPEVTDKCKELVDRFKYLAKPRETEEELDDSLRSSTEEEPVIPVVGKRLTVRVKREPIIPVASSGSHNSQHGDTYGKPRRLSVKRPVNVESKVETVMDDGGGAPESPLEYCGDDDDDENFVNELEAEEISKADEDSDGSNDDKDWSAEEERQNRKRKNLINTPASAAKRRKGTRGHTCSECGNHFLHLPQFLAHRREHRKTRNSTLSEYFDTSYEQGDGKKRGKLFKKCKRCDFRSSEKGLQHYAEHLLSHEQDTTPTSGPNGQEIYHSCNLCSEIFILKVNLTLHKFWVHDPFATRLKCDICVDPVNYDSKEELITHLKLHVNKIHSCKSCSVSCSTLDGLLEHMLKHGPSKRLFCPECDALPPFTSTYNLYRHCSIEHKDLKKMFDCNSCEKSFLTADLLRLHATKQHRIFDDENGETCGKCADGLLFYSKESLDSHLKTVHAPKAKFKCERCDRSFAFPGDLRRHVARIHEEVRFLCPHCPKSYADEFTLDEHIRIHTGEGAFACPTCGKELSSKYALKSHERSHLELPKDPISVCDICGKELYSDAQLKRHMQSHRDKKFPCSVCNLQFKRRDHLKSHSIIHSGARPFECGVCRKGFNKSDILRVHMKGVHGIVVETKLTKKE